MATNCRPRNIWHRTLKIFILLFSIGSATLYITFLFASSWYLGLFWHLASMVTKTIVFCWPFHTFRVLEARQNYNWWCPSFSVYLKGCPSWGRGQWDLPKNLSKRPSILRHGLAVRNVREPLPTWLALPELKRPWRNYFHPQEPFLFGTTMEVIGTGGSTRY